MDEILISDAITQLLVGVGEDIRREGLIDTPERISHMFMEIFRGYDPKQIPKMTIFKNGHDGILYDEMILDTGEFYSMCEHHMMPFFGRYWFAYIPSATGGIIGLSKIARVVDYFSARLQIQERLCRDIIKYIEASIGQPAPLGMGLVMEGEHLCKTMRGAKKRGKMKTSYLTGAFRTDERVRTEFFNLIS